MANIQYYDVILKPVITEKSMDLMADTEARKRGEQTGLDTLVVHAVNDEY